MHRDPARPMRLIMTAWACLTAPVRSAVAVCLAVAVRPAVPVRATAAVRSAVPVRPAVPVRATAPVRSAVAVRLPAPRRSALVARSTVPILLGLALIGALLTGCSGPGRDTRPSDTAASPGATADGREAPSALRPTWTPPAGTDLADRTRYAAALEDGVNAARMQLGVPPLEHDDCLAAVAEERAAALIGAAELTHAPLPPVQRSCPGGTIAAENLSRTDRPPQDVVQAWLDSPTHRDNLVSTDLLRGAIGCVRDGGTTGLPVLVCSHVFLG
ncbi:CAP domain-containing protein [Promicromonospora sp. NPDC052451]|uniref:CAP domain-containing protein n=1 Tax=unclassified Promicromonospora TaxID=2647929 RepID=UPI0037C6BD93